jgi:hypothetical protein
MDEARHSEIPHGRGAPRLLLRARPRLEQLGGAD